MQNIGGYAQTGATVAAGGAAALGSLGCAFKAGETVMNSIKGDGAPTSFQRFLNDKLGEAGSQTSQNIRNGVEALAWTGAAVLCGEIALGLLDPDESYVPNMGLVDTMSSGATYVGGEVSSGVTYVGGEISSGATYVGDGISSGVTSAGETAITAKNAVLDAGAKAGNAVYDNVAAGLSWVGAAPGNVASSVGTFFGYGAEDVGSDAVPPAGDLDSTGVPSATNSGSDEVSAAGNSDSDGVSAAGKPTVEDSDGVSEGGVMSSIKNGLDKAGQVLTDVTDAVVDLKDAAVETAQEFHDSTAGKVIEGGTGLVAGGVAANSDVAQEVGKNFIGAAQTGFEAAQNLAQRGRDAFNNRRGGN